MALVISIPRQKKQLKLGNVLSNVKKKLDCNPMIGREIYPLLKNSGFKNINVSPKIIYVDSSKARLVERI